MTRMTAAAIIFSMHNYTRVYRSKAGGKELCTVSPFFFFFFYLLLFGISPRFDRFKHNTTKVLSVTPPKEINCNNNPVIEMRLSTTKYCIFSNSKKISPTNIFFFSKGFSDNYNTDTIKFCFPPI